MLAEKVYTKERWKDVNIKNKELLDDYLVELKSKRRKPSTLAQYKCDGRMILCYIKVEMHNKYILDFNKKDFRKLSLWLTEERAVSNARFNRVFSLIRGMCDYAEDEEDYGYDRNVARRVKGLAKEPVKEIVFLTDEQIHKIRNYLIENGMYRECVYLDLSYDSAARINEIAQVKKNNILERRVTNTVIGKRGKKFQLLYHKNTLESLRLYLEQRGEDTFDTLWVSLRTQYRHELSRSALYEWCIKFRDILASLEGEKYLRFSPHAFRHSALENYKKGTHYMCKELGKEEGFTIEELQALAHHENMDMTKSYLKPDQNDILENMFQIKIG